MSAMPKKAMVLAAGLGLRMRPITTHTPKPLVAVAGRTMLDRVLDHLAAAGVEEAVVNLHHLPDVLRAHLAARSEGPRVTLSDETDALLETGGGVKRALPLLGDAPFFVVNADIVWLNGARPALARLAEAWDPARMDALLLFKRTADAHGYDGAGDFFLDPDGVPTRRGEKQVAPHIFAGVQILSPQALEDTPEGAWSLNLVFDRLLARGRLRAIAHDGPWFHVGTPDAIAPTEEKIRAALAGEDFGEGSA
ncbi:nucleotidyltransferase family protein [Novispirillum sp. DQ9]|uniref:nucleotidyltransferase family protein n=1 Tax=Novispirillum sp. DQ9 TaxID=3398612 RepID=UPI003C7E35EA